MNNLPFSDPLISWPEWLHEPLRPWVSWVAIGLTVAIVAWVKL